MPDKQDIAEASLDPPDAPLRDADGTLRADFVEQVQEAIESANVEVLRDLVGELHEADVGDLIEALDPELRPRLIELPGKTSTSPR